MCTFVLSDNRGMSEDMGSLHYLPSWYLAILFETRSANYTPKMNAVVSQGRFILRFILGTSCQMNADRSAGRHVRLCTRKCFD